MDPDKDVKIEYYSEASEVTAQMAATKKDAIAVLPQPYVTAAQMKDSELRVVLDLTKEWNKVCDTQLITGVTVVRTAYAEDDTPRWCRTFLKDYQKSVNAANDRHRRAPPPSVKRSAWWPRLPSPKRLCPSATSSTAAARR